jgi:hypothetical protein
MIHDGILFRTKSKDRYRNMAEDVLKDGQWEGKQCFLIGGGESLKGFDFSKLEGELTIGINRAFEAFTPSIWYSMDRTFLKFVEDGDVDEQKFRALSCPKIFAFPESDGIFYPDLYFLRRKSGLSKSIVEGCDPGSNSGYGALMLAAALGATTIFLLGYDMTVKESTHWHAGYPDQQLRIQKTRVERYAEGFNKIASELRTNGIKVYNLNKDSGLNCFIKVGIESAIREPEDATSDTY